VAGPPSGSGMRAAGTLGARVRSHTAGPEGGRKPPAGRQDPPAAITHGPQTQVHLARRRPARNPQIVQGDLVQDDEHIRWRDPNGYPLGCARPQDMGWVDALVESRLSLAPRLGGALLTVVRAARLPGWWRGRRRPAG
jgi:hypothetical protein